MQKNFFYMVLAISAALTAFMAAEAPLMKQPFRGVDLGPAPVRDSVRVRPVFSNAFPALLVRRSEGDTTSVPLHMSELNVDVKVVGMISATTMEMTFSNDLERVLEGQFYFPLGEGQTVSGFALEVGSSMREGVVVEKAKGRQVFEQVVRTRIDPGLLEWTKGNNYRARIFPIPAKGTKKIRITFEQELLTAATGYIYFLPMKFKDKIDDFSIHVEVVKQTVKPETEENELTTLNFKEWQDSWIADEAKKDFLADKPLAFSIPQTSSTQRMFSEPGEKAGERYFYLMADPHLQAREKKLPGKICLLWDASGSSMGRAIDREKQVLDMYFKKIQNLSVQLVAFSNDVHTTQMFTVVNGNWGLLRDAIDDIEYDGGTQLGALDLSKYTCDEFLLCSDGISNFGKAEAKLSSVPVMAICSGQSADHSYLKYIAQSTNGQFINLLTTQVADAGRMLGAQPYRFISAEFDKTKISQTYPSIPTDPGKMFSLSGICTGDAEVKLNFGFGNEIIYSEKVLLKDLPVAETGLVKRTWAQKKISELDVRYEKNKDEITELGKKHSIVTRNTSLIVLDRIEDYVTHRIVPPEKELEKQYWALVNAREKQTTSGKKEHIENVVKAFNERLAWWKTDFKPQPFHKKAKDGTGMYRDSSGAGLVLLGTGDFSMGRVSDSMLVADSVGNIIARPGLVRMRETGNNGTATDQQRNYRYADNISMRSDSISVAAFSTSSGTMNATATGGTFSYGWSYGDAANGGLEVSQGTYTVDVTDASGCSQGFFAYGNSCNLGSMAKESEITIKPWSSNAEYLEELKKTGRKDLYAVYLKLRKQYSIQPAFFLDAADYFFTQGEMVNGLRILSNLSELELEDPAALRVMAHRLQQAGFMDLAVTTFREVLKIREEEPQSYRDLGLALAEKKEYQEAVDVLSKVVNRNWDSRFPEVEVFVAGEINNIISTCGMNLRTDSLDERLINPMPVDMRVVINWDSNNCDIDLWATDPIGEKCMYNHARTQAGGMISKDFTGGYGPEEFMVKKALNGKYLIQVNYYGTSQQTLFGPATIQAQLYTNYGRPGQKKKEITLRMKESKEVVDIGELAILP